MNLRSCRFLAVVVGWAGIISAATISPQPNLPVTSRGQSVVVYGDGFPNEPITVYLRSGKEGKGDLGYKLPGAASADQKSVTFKLPDDAPTGDYLVFLDFDTTELAVPGELRILADASAKVTLDSIAPTTDYSNPDSESFDFVIAAENLAQHASAGYLAGKFVRQPGPIIELLTILKIMPPANGNPAVIKMEVKGQNLSDTAIIKVDKDELRMDQFIVTGVIKQDQPAGSSFYSKVNVDLLDAAAYLAGSHLLFLVNDDGQSACETFPMNALSLDALPPINSGDAQVTITLVGRNFASGFHGTWIDAAKVAHTIADDDIEFVDENHLKVTLTPGPAGTGKLILETPIHLSGIAEITVRKSL